MTIFEFGQLHRATADIGVAGADSVAHLLHGDAEVAHPKRIEHDVILLDEATDAGDFGDAFGFGERELQIPVLDRPCVGKVQFLGHDRVLVDPADAGGVGAHRRRDAGGQAGRGSVQEFENARPGPVDVGPVFEDDIDERHAEEREPAHHFRFRHREHCRRQRIGDLILDHLRRLAGVLGIDDNLRVGEIRDGVERQMRQRVDASGCGEPCAEQHQQQIARRPCDDAGDHCGLLASEKPFSAAFRLLSASIRKLAEMTTGSPFATPSRIST
jgi:hypothetical protein